MAQDVASVRAELKTWERNFLDERGRNPTADDIRANQIIANKYRLYKKLSKVTSLEKPGPSEASSGVRSSTPPTKTVQSSSVLLRPRALDSTSALSSYNPFSPQKIKAKQEQSLNATNAHFSASNPFPTPSKVKPKPRITEGLLSPANESAPALVLPQNPSPEPPTAVRRARKRLRGEPVSPSPHKDKRRRIHIGPMGSDSSESDETDDETGNSYFVANSPVKGSTSFKSLFEDPSLSTQIGAPLTRAKSTSIPTALFRSFRARSISAEDDLESVLGPVSRSAKPRPNAVPLSSVLFPGKDNLNARRDPSIPPTQMTLAQSGKGGSSKRSHPGSDNESGTPAAKISNSSLLIPPSPPPGEASSQRPTGNKVKAKIPSRKKAKVEEEEEDPSLSDDVKVIIQPLQGIERSQDDDSNVGHDFDPLFSYPHLSVDGDIGTGNRAPNTFEVDLPDKLRHVLALSTSDAVLRDMQEEHVAEALIYGRPTTRYEASKGGEIWNVGDVEGSHGSDETIDQIAVSVMDDEDWEGEPVPWEVGEL